MKIDIKNIEQYRGKNYALKIDTQEQWNTVIPMFRKYLFNPFTKEDFDEYEKIVIYLDNFNKEYYGDLKNVNLKKYTVISLNYPIIELW